MVTKLPKCKGCEQRNIPYHPLWSFPNSSGLHVDLNKQPLCEKCIIKTKDDKDNKGLGTFIGYLSKQETEEYRKNVEADVHKKLLEEGVAVIDGLSLKKGQSVSDLSLLFYKMLRDKKLRPLRESVDDIKKKSTNDHRVWNNIYSEDDNKSNKNTAKMNALCTPLLTELASRLMPHRHYALTAHLRYKSHINNTMGSLLDGGNIRKRAIDHQRDTDAVLNLEKVNVLVRGPQLKSRQGAHIDGLSYKLIALLVDHTEGGYEFLYVAGSHNIKNHMKLLDKEFPERLMKRMLVKKGDLITFFECTIHSGGKASKQNDDATETTTGHSNCDHGSRLMHNEWIKGLNWFKHAEGTLPSDVSFQLSLRHGYLSDSGTVPNRTNLWYKNLVSNDENNSEYDDEPKKETQIELEIKASRNNGQQRLSSMDSDFMDRMTRVDGWRKSRRRTLALANIEGK